MELLILFTVREFSKYNAGFFLYSFFIMFEIIHFPTINHGTVRIRITMFSSEYVLNIHTCSGNDALNDPICHWATWPVSSEISGLCEISDQPWRLMNFAHVGAKYMTLAKYMTNKSKFENVLYDILSK